MSSTANASNNINNNGDSWANSRVTIQKANVPNTRASKAAKHVPDTWDDDEDDEGEEEEKEVGVNNAAVWNDANEKQPMPQVILRSSSTSTSAAPPPEVLQQPMRILKRPSASGASTANPASTAGSGGGAGGTLKDREAAYQAARARIFGGSADGGKGASEVDSELHETQERLKAANLSGSKHPSPIPSSTPSPKLSQPTPSLASSSSTLATTSSKAASTVLRNPLGPPTLSRASSTNTNGSVTPISDAARSSPKGFAKRRGGGGGSASNAKS